MIINGKNPRKISTSLTFNDILYFISGWTSNNNDVIIFEIGRV